MANKLVIETCHSCSCYGVHIFSKIPICGIQVLMSHYFKYTSYAQMTKEAKAGGLKDTYF